MVIQTISALNCTPQTIVIGRRGTYDTMHIAFDLSYLIESYGSGTAVLAIKRSQDESAYPAVVTQDGNTLTWTITETDTYYVGSGECQLMWYVDGGLAKTIIYPMVVMRDILSTTEEPPDGYENWIEHLTELGAETQQNAQEAKQSATEAKSSEDSAAKSAQRAEDAAGLLVDVSATATTLDPGQPATAEYNDGVFEFGIPKGDKLTYADLTEADKEDLVQGPIKDAQDDAVEAVGTAKTTAVGAVNQAGTTNKNAVTQEGTTQVNTVREAGTTQVGRVTTEGNTQVGRVQDKGDEVIASIPSDYSALVDDVTDLTRQLSDVEENQIPELKSADSDVQTIIDTEYITEQIAPTYLVDGYALDGVGGYVINADTQFAKYQVLAGHTYYIRAEKSSAGVWQWQSNQSVNNSHEYLIGTPVTEATNGMFIAPPSATWLIVSHKISGDYNTIEEVKNYINPTLNAVLDEEMLVSGMMQGTNSGGQIVANNTRIITEKLYKARSGDTVSFTAGNKVSNIVIVRYDNNGVFIAEDTGWLGTTEYQVVNTAYYRFVYRKSDNGNISPADYDATTIIKFQNNPDVPILKKQMEVVEERKTAIDYFEHPDMELGDLYVNGIGTGTYYNSTTRMRTIKDHPLQLRRGDIIGLSDKNAAVFTCYKKTSNVYMTIKIFNSDDLLIVEDGEYEIVLRYSTEATITDPDALAELLYIKRAYSILREKTNVENLTDVYKDELQTTIDTARAKTTSRGLMFAVITDTHLDNKRVGYYNQTMENLERLNNGLQFNGVFHLGDIINGYNSASIAKFHLGYAVDRLLKIAPECTYITVGNHDNNNGAGDNERLTDAELYSYIQRFNERYVVRTMEATSSVYDSPTANYYFDYANFKLRMIVFDSCYYSQGFSDDMIAWMSDVLANLPSDYHVVLWTHMSTEKELNGGSALGNASAFKALLAQYKDKIYCYIHGHTHYDYVGYTNEFAQIALCSGVPDQPSSSVPEGGIQPSRTIGTVTQDCISVIIILPDEGKVELVRFGAGSDMSIPFRQS